MLARLRPFFSVLLLTLAFHFAAPISAQDRVFVSPEWAFNHQDKLLFIDLSEQGSYQKFHLPNAQWLNYHWLIKPQNGLALSGGPEYMAKLLSQQGITRDTHLVLYDDMGNLNASRLYWELKKLQHKNVDLLDGGIVAWILQGFPVTQQATKRPAPKTYLMPQHTLTDALTADKSDVIQAINTQSAILLDTRSMEEYIGDPNLKRSGHIPGALWFEWSRALNLENGYRQQDKAALLKRLAQLGIQDPKTPIITYCQSAHRAARVFSMLGSLGFEQVKLYDGSMQEYTLDPRLKLTQGSTP